MNWFGLLLAHLVGDYIVQNDWMAANKSNPHPGPEPKTRPVGTSCGEIAGNIFAGVRESKAYHERFAVWRLGHAACAAHCTAYTLAVWAFSWWWMPWWGLAVCWLAHYPIDRFGLAKLWMKHVSGQAVFAEKMAPWSIIVVDNTAHLLTLWLIAVFAGIT